MSSARAGWLTVAVLAALLPGGVASAGKSAGRPGRVERFAIVIGNNHSGRADMRELRYADDDAVAMHRLLGEAGVRSELYVALDAESGPLYPGLSAHGRPRWSDLRAGLDRIERSIAAARRAGAITTLLFFYSGHGDVEHGEGYVELEDAHLTRSLLRRQILDRTAADRIHVVVDACRSYFLAFEKGPGGKRRRAAAAPLVDRDRERTGYILSTSSDRESHEWEAYQGGIFSHEVRSALRGAADVDRDGSVTYAELGGFLTVANRGIRNARFRPDFVVRPPADLSDELLRWESPGAQTLLLDLSDQGHMVLEGPSGERVLDVHAAEGQTLLLYLPAQRPLFLRGAGGDREFAIDASRRSLRLSSLRDGRVRVASKGALHLAFNQLFSAPFGEEDVVRYREKVASAMAAERVGAALETRVTPRDEGSGRATARGVAGATAIGSSVIGVGLSIWAIERSVVAREADQVRRADINETIADARLGAGISLGAALGAALVYWLLDEDDPDPPRLGIAPGGNGLVVSGRF